MRDIPRNVKTQVMGKIKKIKISKSLASLLKEVSPDMLLWGDNTPIKEEELSKFFVLFFDRDEEWFTLEHKVQGYRVENIFASRNVPKFVVYKVFGLKAFLKEWIYRHIFYLESKWENLLWFHPKARNVYYASLGIIEYLNPRRILRLKK